MSVDVRAQLVWRVAYHCFRTASYNPASDAVMEDADKPSKKRKADDAEPDVEAGEKKDKKKKKKKDTAESADGDVTVGAPGNLLFFCEDSDKSADHLNRRREEKEEEEGKGDWQRCGACEWQGNGRGEG